ncbi:NifB/NifX family molybdenum-iron cluster-binding protein [Helicovermis profundi]|uniref:NifB/NifX family molybdenum-iron cluster-binding protein n=1 Tax=Helicovermis profundi TaxID=3065157 RepID=A0AAU9EEW4_9FIRM|nr:NifB/NifX family molybdenum-iron cluster-binding protein [Clostridia bacterium S502]
MKIALTKEGENIAQHFGHCEGFQIVEINGEEVKSEYVANPGHKPGYLPVFLSDMGVKTIISGGMGGKAIDIFAQNGIKVITGAKGSIDKNIESFIKEELESTGSVCNEHEHAGDCGGH